MAGTASSSPVITAQAGELFDVDWESSPPSPRPRHTGRSTSDTSSLPGREARTGGRSSNQSFSNLTRPNSPQQNRTLNRTRPNLPQPNRPLPPIDITPHYERRRRHDEIEYTCHVTFLSFVNSSRNREYRYTGRELAGYTDPSITLNRREESDLQRHNEWYMQLVWDQERIWHCGNCDRPAVGCASATESYDEGRDRIRWIIVAPTCEIPPHAHGRCYEAVDRNMGFYRSWAVDALEMGKMCSNCRRQLRAPVIPCQRCWSAG